MRVRPVGRQVLVKPFKDEIQYGKLHLPDSAKVRSNNGIVYATGERTTDVSRGDWVLFSRRQATDLEVEGAAFVLVDERACFALLAEKEDVPILVYCDKYGVPENFPHDHEQIRLCEEVEECDVYLWTPYSDRYEIGYAVGIKKQILRTEDIGSYLDAKFPTLIHHLKDPDKLVEAIKFLGGAL